MRGYTRRVLMVAAALAVPAQPLVAQEQIETCPAPIGTLAVVEPQDQTIHALRGYGLGSPTSLIRMLVQKSNCFQVVERGAGLQTMQAERELARSGDLQQGSNVGGGQIKAADFLLTPNVLFANNNAGGVGGAIGGLLGRRGYAVGAVLGGLKFKEAQTSMLVGDTRTGVQVAAAEGHARKTDFNFGALGFGGGMLSAVGGYSNTAEGKVIAASFLDNFNQIVVAIRGNPALASGSDAPAMGAVFNEGDVVSPKIDNVPLLADPAEGARSLATVGKGDELVVVGAPRDGYVHVQTAAGAGWVRAVLIARR